MLPCKKRRTTLTESAQHQGNQEEDDVDLQADGKPESDLGSVKDLGSVSLCGVQVVAEQLTLKCRLQEFSLVWRTHL